MVEEPPLSLRNTMVRQKSATICCRTTVGEIQLERKELRCIYVIRQALSNIPFWAEMQGPCGLHIYTPAVLTFKPRHATVPPRGGKLLGPFGLHIYYERMRGVSNFDDAKTIGNPFRHRRI